MTLIRETIYAVMFSIFATWAGAIFGLGLGLFVLDAIFEDRFGFQTALLWIKGILT